MQVQRITKSLQRSCPLFSVFRRNAHTVGQNRATFSHLLNMAEALFGRIQKERRNFYFQTKKNSISPWLSARPDNREGRFIQLGNSLLLSKDFQTLDVGARYLYFCMAMESGGRREFLFPESAAKKYGLAPSSFRRYLKELASRRLIRIESMKNLRQPNRYAFVSDWKLPSVPLLHASPMAICSKSSADRDKRLPF